jgi:hypothetical protein
MCFEGKRDREDNETVCKNKIEKITKKRYRLALAQNDSSFSAHV